MSRLLESRYGRKRSMKQSSCNGFAFSSFLDGIALILHGVTVSFSLLYLLLSYSIL